MATDYLSEYKNTDAWKELSFEMKEDMLKEAMFKDMAPNIQKMTDFVNGYSYRDLAEILFKTVNNTHRYLQGEFMMALFKFIKKYGEEAGYDGRNEFVVKKARELSPVLKEFFGE
jgi:hypothetical protein